MVERWAMCLGGADCVWDDVLAWEALYGKQWDGLIIAANDIGAHWPRDLDHWVSLHPDKFVHWAALRASHHFTPLRGEYWGKGDRWGRARERWPLVTRTLNPWAGGSSGMFTVQVAQELGCTRVVLCGIPMTATAHFAETTERFNAQWAGAAGHWRAWGRQKDKMFGWVRSMSGRTQEMLGSPTREWLFSDGGSV